MDSNASAASLIERHALAVGPLSGVTARYIEVLRAQRYAEHTIGAYLRSLAHFNRWMRAEGLVLARLDAALIKRFLHGHLPTCTCPPPGRCALQDARAALGHLLGLVPPGDAVAAAADPIGAELQRFGEHLLNTHGLAPQSCAHRCRQVGVFLRRQFGTQAPVMSQLSAAQVEGFLTEQARRLQPASIRVVCISLRSYFRFRAVLGDSTEALAAALPSIPAWKHTTLPKALSEAQLEAFLSAFDQSDPVGLRDYAIARCLVDLGLRGHEVAHLGLDAVNWRAGVLTLSGTKSKRLQQLPLPVRTGEAIARYLRRGRPQTINRALFVRHRAPADKPLSVAAIRTAMNRAFVRCGLRDQFCSTHVLRRTTATRLQRAGASVKEIADLLRHQSLDTVSTYARVDLEGLRALALPWPGARP